MSEVTKESPLKNNSDYADALNDAMDQIAGAHRLVDAVKKSVISQKNPEPEALHREISRVWNSIDISGALCARLYRHFDQNR